MAYAETVTLHPKPYRKQVEEALSKRAFSSAACRFRAVLRELHASMMVGGRKGKAQIFRGLLGLRV